MDAVADNIQYPTVELITTSDLLELKEKLTWIEQELDLIKKQDHQKLLALENQMQRQGWDISSLEKLTPEPIIIHLNKP